MTAAKPKADKPAKETKPKAPKAEAVKADVSPVLSDETVAGASQADRQEKGVGQGNTDQGADTSSAPETPTGTLVEALKEAPKGNTTEVKTKAATATSEVRTSSLLGLSLADLQAAARLARRALKNGYVLEVDIPAIKRVAAALEADENAAKEPLRKAALAAKKAEKEKTKGK